MKLGKKLSPPFLICKKCHRIDRGDKAYNVWSCRHVVIDYIIKHKDWPLTTLRDYLEKK